MKWLNLLGLSLQFLAFWFAAPELLGAQTLARFEKGLIALVAKVPTLFIGLVATAAGIGMSVYGITTGLNAAKGAVAHLYLTLGGIILISIFLVLYFTVFAKRTQKWLQLHLAVPLVQKLTHNHESRKTALIIAALIFTLGFAFQFVALLLS